MRKTVLFIRFALCIAIGLVGSSLFATARAISVPNPFVKAHDILVQKLPVEHQLASIALAASEKSQLSNTAILASISSQKIVEPLLEKKDENNVIIPQAVTITPEPSVISAAIGTSIVTPEDIPTPVVSISPMPLLTPTPTLVAPSATVSQEPTGGLNADVLFSMINNTRTKSGLPAFEKNDLTCSVAAARAPEIKNEVFGSSYMHAGFYARNVAGATENLISINSDQAALNWWMNSPVHRSAILGSSKYSCIACSGTSCSEIFN
ncbi:hypothetical protein BH11PAT1_BH11PAT1_4640 [soil metagenome]